MCLIPPRLPLFHRAPQNLLLRAKHPLIEPALRYFRHLRTVSPPGLKRVLLIMLPELLHEPHCGTAGRWYIGEVIVFGPFRPRIAVEALEAKREVGFHPRLSVDAVREVAEAAEAAEWQRRTKDALLDAHGDWCEGIRCDVDDELEGVRKRIILIFWLLLSDGGI